VLSESVGESSFTVDESEVPKECSPYAPVGVLKLSKNIQSTQCTTQSTPESLNLGLNFTMRLGEVVSEPAGP